MKVGDKSLESVIDKVLMPIRINPVVALSIVSGPVLLAGSLTLFQSDTLWVRWVGGAMLGSSFGGTMLGIYLYLSGVMYYREVKRLMSFQRAPEHIQGIIESNLPVYCNRNACHAAAIALGFGEEFRQINSKHKAEGKYREWNWVPGV